MALIIENLSFAYGSLRALSSVSVRAERGRIVAVVGPNASGKSTLLRCIIAAQRPQSGTVKWGDNNVHLLSPRALASRIAYVPQRSIVSAAFTAKQVVELGRYALPMSHPRVNAAIEALDLTEVQNRAYRTLSVGQQQRVTLARAIAQLEPNGLLVLDEPTAAMDLQHAALAYRILRNAATGGATVLLAMHDLASAAIVADDVWLLNDGRLIASGTACDVLQPDRLQMVFGVGFEWVSDAAGRARLIADWSPLADRA